MSKAWLVFKYEISDLFHLFDLFSFLSLCFFLLSDFSFPSLLFLLPSFLFLPPPAILLSSSLLPLLSYLLSLILPSLLLFLLSSSQPPFSPLSIPVNSPEEKRQMLEILKRLEERGEDDVDEGDKGTQSLEERLAGLDLEKETDVVWQRLTPSERREFQEIVTSGKMGHLLSVYTPWWEVSL